MLEKPGSDGGRTEFQSFIVRRTEPGVRNQKVANCALGLGWGGERGWFLHGWGHRYQS